MQVVPSECRDVKAIRHARGWALYNKTAVLSACIFQKLSFAWETTFQPSGKGQRGENTRRGTPNRPRGHGHRDTALAHKQHVRWSKGSGRGGFAPSVKGVFLASERHSHRLASASGQDKYLPSKKQYGVNRVPPFRPCFFSHTRLLTPVPTQMPGAPYVLNTLQTIQAAAVVGTTPSRLQCSV